MKAKGILLVVAACATSLLVQPVLANNNIEGEKAAPSITAKDIDRSTRALRRAICSSKNSKNQLTKAKHIKAANDERKRIGDMKKSLEADGKLKELEQLDRAAKNAEAAANC